MGRGGKYVGAQRGKGKLDRQDGKQPRERTGNRSRGGKRSLDESARPLFQRTVFEDIENVKKQEIAITELRTRNVLCPICGKKIEDIESAVSDRQSMMPAHFDCVIKNLSDAEHIGKDENIVYIGQGKFAVMRYENKNDPKTFHIVRKIEWEARSSDIPWRQEISTLFSQVL